MTPGVGDSRPEAQDEMRANYPHFKRAVYASLRKKFERELGPLPEKDLRGRAGGRVGKVQ